MMFLATMVVSHVYLTLIMEMDTVFTSAFCAGVKETVAATIPIATMA